MKTTVTIEYYNPPEPKKPGSIKADGVYYKFWEDFADKEYLRKGATVELVYKVEKRGQYENNMLEAARPAGGGPSNVGTQHSPVNSPTSSVDERTAMMLTSYAKDLMCHGIAKTASEAVSIVKIIKNLVEVLETQPPEAASDYDPFAE